MGTAAVLVVTAGVAGFVVARLVRWAARPGHGSPGVLHELSQPLSAAAGLAGILTSDWSDLADESRLELAKDVETELVRLVETVRRYQSGGASRRRG